MSWSGRGKQVDSLAAWDKHPHPQIRHFSGKPVYHRSFELNPEQASGLVRLQLGEVKHVAQVRLNGRDLGVVWTAPWADDLTGVVRPGENELEIDVVNLWVKRQLVMMLLR